MLNVKGDMKRFTIASWIAILLLSMTGLANALLIDNLDGTVSDTETGLMWQQYGLTPSNWHNAVQYCENLKLAGYDDWYLPDLHSELIIILDTSVMPKSAAAIDTSLFPDTIAGGYWTSLEYNSGNAYLLVFNNLQDNHANLSPKTTHGYVRAVRQITADPVPEPSTMLLLGAGLLGLIGLRRKLKS